MVNLNCKMFNSISRILNLHQEKYICLYSKMPKKQKNNSETKNNDSEKNSASKADKGAVYLGKNSEIIVKIHAKPGAKESAITDIGSEAVGVQIGAPPVDGEANKEIIRYLAEILKLRKSDISLERGSRSKYKTVMISKDASLTSVLEALQSASKQ